MLRLILALFLVSVAPTVRADAPLTVFAAASLKTALEEIADAYEDKSGTTIVLSFAGSSALARQIQFGAPADVFISANTDWMDVLGAKGHLSPDSRFDLASNRIVLIGAAGTDPVDLSDTDALTTALQGGRLAMALVDAVPAGIYGKAALQSLDQWERLAPHVAQADNVRAALALVALGEAPLGIVYATDAAAEPRVSVRAVFPTDTHPPIRYPAAALSSASPAAAPFLAFLATPEVQDILAAHGFLPGAD